MQRIFTISMVGDHNVGKTSIYNRYVHNKSECPPFVGVVLLRKTITLDNHRIELELFDVHDCVKYWPIRINPIRRSNGIFLVYDITNRESFDRLKDLWYKEVSRYVNKRTKCVLIGNKCDLESERAVECSAGKEFADNLGINFIETSAVEGHNVEKAFVLITAIITKELRELGTDGTDTIETNVESSRYKCY